MKSIIEGINGSLTVGVHIADSVDLSIPYAIANGYATVSRSTTGLEDSGYPQAWNMLSEWGIVVHSMGENSPTENTGATTLDAISTARFDGGSYGAASEFTLTEYGTDSSNTAYLAGKYADYATRFPLLSFSVIRQQLRANASNGGTWTAITGYGTPDWDATETALSNL